MNNRSINFICEIEYECSSKCYRACGLVSPGHLITTTPWPRATVQIAPKFDNSGFVE